MNTYLPQMDIRFPRGERIHLNPGVISNGSRCLPELRDVILNALLNCQAIVTVQSERLLLEDSGSS